MSPFVTGFITPSHILPLGMKLQYIRDLIRSFMLQFRYGYLVRGPPNKIWSCVDSEYSSLTL
jgi:hypothetical protein